MAKNFNNAGSVKAIDRVKNVEKEKAQDAIERLINNTHFDSFAEMDMVWDMVANLLD